MTELPPMLTVLVTRREPGGNQVRYNGLKANYESFMKQEYPGPRYLVIVDTSPDGPHPEVKAMMEATAKAKMNAREKPSAAYIHFTSIEEARLKYGNVYPGAIQTLITAAEREKTPFYHKKFAEHAALRPELTFDGWLTPDGAGERIGIGMPRNFGVELGQRKFGLNTRLQQGVDSFLTFWDDDDSYGPTFLRTVAEQLLEQRGDYGRFQHYMMYAWHKDPAQRYITYQSTPPLRPDGTLDPGESHFLICRALTETHNKPIVFPGFIPPPASEKDTQTLAHYIHTLVRQGVDPAAAAKFYEDSITNLRYQRHRCSAIEEGPAITARLSLYNKISKENIDAGGRPGAFHITLGYEDILFITEAMRLNAKRISFKLPEDRSDEVFVRTCILGGRKDFSNVTAMLVADSLDEPVPPSIAQRYAYFDNPVPARASSLLRTLKSISGHLKRPGKSDGGADKHPPKDLLLGY